jgi:hypothetical protein
MNERERKSRDRPELRDAGETDGAAGSQVEQMLSSPDPRVRAAITRRIKARNERVRSAAEDKALAGQFRQLMKAKVASVQTTVHQAAELFQNAILADKLVDKEANGSADMLLDKIVGIVISQLSGGFAKFLANELKFLEKALKEILKMVGKGAYANEKKKPADEKDLIDQVIAVAEEAGRFFVSKAKPLIDAMPDDQAAADMRMLSAVRSSPAVREESFEDDPQDGDVERGVENLFLESAGAPVTGDGQAEALAFSMLQTYKLERVRVFDTIGQRNDVLHDAMSGRSAAQIKQAERDIGMDESIQADKAERRRASELTNPIVPPRGKSSEEEPVS